MVDGVGICASVGSMTGREVEEGEHAERRKRRRIVVMDRACILFKEVSCL
jgi:hypothetical protein